MRKLWARIENIFAGKCSAGWDACELSSQSLGAAALRNVDDGNPPRINSSFRRRAGAGKAVSDYFIRAAMRRCLVCSSNHKLVIIRRAWVAVGNQPSCLELLRRFVSAVFRRAE